MSAARDRTGCHTESGRRPVNQDAVVAVRLADGRELVAVADGMGGHSAGEVASRCAVEAVWSQLKAGADLVAAVEAANQAVRAQAAGNPAWSGMGTTLVAMLRSGATYEIVNVGDSRAYRISDGAVVQVTQDHSVIAEAMRTASGDSAEVARSRWRHALTRALGTDAEVQVDRFGPFDAREPHAVLLCTDGLYRSVPEERLARHLSGTPDPWTAARTLVQEAWAAGSSDNISAAVMLMGGAVDVLPASGARGSATSQRRTPEPLTVPPRRRRRRVSRHARRVEIQLALTIAVLIAAVWFLMRMM